MAAPAQLGVYLAVLRKHVLLLAISAPLVVAAGVFYVMRQEPVFLSAATLVIETPVRNVAGSSGEYADMLAADQDELQTQMLIFKQKRELARKAVEMLAAAGVDVAAGGYSESTLPSLVKVDFIPGTRAISFSLTGPDRDSLPKAVNAYAQVFQEWSEGKSAKRSDLQAEEFQKAVDAAEAKLKELQDGQSRLVSEHPEVNVAGVENADDPKVSQLQLKMTKLESELESDAVERDAIFAALARVGVEAVKAGAGYRLSVKAQGDPLELRLLDDERIAALECVKSNPVVAKRLRDESDAVERERKARASSLVDKTESQAALREVGDARVRLGTKIAGAIEDELTAIDARAGTRATTATRLAAERARVGEITGLRLRYRQFQDAIDSQNRKVDATNAALKSFQTVFLRGPDAQGTSARATRRIVMETPATGAAQIAPKIPLIIGLTAFAAVAVGLGLVLLFEYLDDTVKSKEDFDRYVGLPFLGFIPRIDAKEAVNPDTAANAKTGSAIAEAFRSVRTSILFSRSDKPVRTILVTSAGPGEGKTTVATNLAITLAKHKGPVLLVDADLRRPRVAKALGLENTIGLTNYLIGEATLDDVVQKTSIEGLFAIASGPIPPNPAELLHGERLAELMKLGLERFDRIVIDSPPVIAVSDARVIARCADGLYLVISMGKTSWRVIQRSLESLTSIGFEVHGAILNNLAAPTGRYGYYYYRDYEYGKSYYVQPGGPAAAPGQGPPNATPSNSVVANSVVANSVVANSVVAKPAVAKPAVAKPVAARDA